MTRPRSRPRVAPGVLAGLCVAAGALTWCFELAADKISPTTADAATALLEGHSLATGNLLLRGWSLSLDSFWGLEALFYALGDVVVGVHLYLLHLVPALIAACVVVVGVRIACYGFGGLQRVLAAGTVAVMLVVPDPVLTYFFLQGPWHICTLLYCLVAMWLVTGGRRALPFAGAVALLTVGVVSDLMTLVLGVVPCIVYGLASAVRTRSWRTGGVPLAAGALSVACALVVRALGPAVGLFTLANRNLVISPKQLGHNASLLVPRLVSLLGVGHLRLAPVPVSSTVDEVARAVVGALAAAAVLVGLVRLARAAWSEGPPSLARGRQAEALLVLAVVFDLAFFVVGSANGHVEFTKYLTPAIICVAILAARSLAESSRGLGAALGRTGSALGLVGAAALVGICGAQYVTGASSTAPPQKTHQLVAFLASRHLTDGFASYPIAPLVSADSSLRDLVGPVEADPAGVLVSFDRQRDAAWYGAGTFRFLIFDRTRSWHGVSAGSAVRTFGPFERSYLVGPYQVLVWAHPLHVALNVMPGANPLRLFLRS